MMALQCFGCIRENIFYPSWSIACLLLGRLLTFLQWAWLISQLALHHKASAMVLQRFTNAFAVFSGGWACQCSWNLVFAFWCYPDGQKFLVLRYTLLTALITYLLWLELYQLPYKLYQRNTLSLYWFSNFSNSCNSTSNWPFYTSCSMPFFYQLCSICN